MYLELCNELAVMRGSRFSSVQMLYMKPFLGTEGNDNGEDEDDSNRITTIIKTKIQHLPNTNIIYMLNFLFLKFGRLS